MNATVVKRPDNLKPNRKALSPPVIEEPLYQCATAVTVTSYEPGATLDIDVSGSVTSGPGGFPFPNGVTITLASALTAGKTVRARQKAGGITSPWTAAITVRDHTKDFPAGPPRPEINPAPVYECGVRTGVGNLHSGGHVWITADGAKVGDVNGCATQQGVNVSPAYSFGQNVQAFFELCKDPSPPSAELVAQSPPSPLPAPTIDPTFAGGQSVTVRGIVNGAKVTFYRGEPTKAFGHAGVAQLRSTDWRHSARERVSRRPSRCARGIPGAVREQGRCSLVRVCLRRKSDLCRRVTPR